MRGFTPNPPPPYPSFVGHWLQDSLSIDENTSAMLCSLNDFTLYICCLVVDAHQKWCGPCVAITGMLKRIKNELGDDLLKFATVSLIAKVS